MPSTNHQTLQADGTTGQLTFLEHIQELRTRLFWVVGFVLLTSSLGYIIKDELIAVLTHPLGNQQLYYLTPVGGFSFLIKICFYFGLVVSVPMIVYQLYRYIQPLMNGRKAPMVRYMFFSTLLAMGGVAFAYFVSLPAALHFLTDFNVANITAMLTVDAYLTFVISYLLGAALLFQIPLVLLIINRITPLKPSQMMKYQRHVILVAFIAAAIISPTPDIANQALLALPIIVMYQVGIALVWLSNRKAPVQTPVQPLANAPQTVRQPPALPLAPKLAPARQPLPMQPLVSMTPQPPIRPARVQPNQIRRPQRLISDFGPRRPRGTSVQTSFSSPAPRAFSSIDGVIASKIT